MTHIPPPADSDRGAAPPPADESSADLEERAPSSESAEPLEADSGPNTDAVHGPDVVEEGRPPPDTDDSPAVLEERAPSSESAEPLGADSGPGSDAVPGPDVVEEDESTPEVNGSPPDLAGGVEVDEVGDGVGETIDLQTSSPDEVSLFVAPAQDPTHRPPSVKASREMGWKMMAVAGVLLLAGGFAAGIFFPEWSSPPPETSATTAATVPASEPSTPSTSSPPATSPSTTTASSAPTTTVVDTPAAEVEAPAVEAPPLVATDEPVSDVANRLVPSVVHLEIQSENLFEQGAGSGVVFDSSGYILTAAHVVSTVVDGEAELTVRFSNGDRLPGEVVGTDPDSDIAVIAVERTGLIPAELALDDRPRVGQMVVAVGSPWGLESSVTSGVISAVDRIVEGRLLVQSDAVLYPGNSGGALADRYGRLIGINVSIFTDSTTVDSIEFQGVGFAVPIDIAHRVAQALMEGRPVHTAFLGISGRDTQGDAGVEIMEVFPGSGAEQAGVKAGDVVVGVGGRPVTGIADLAARIRHLSPGDLIVLDVLRGEDKLSLAATLLPRSEVMSGQEDSTEEPPEE